MTDAFEKFYERFIDECESMMSRAEHRKKVAGMDYHTSEIQHQEGRWHCANDLHEWAETALREHQSKQPSEGVLEENARFRAALEIIANHSDNDIDVYQAKQALQGAGREKD